MPFDGCVADAAEGAAGARPDEARLPVAVVEDRAPRAVGLQLVDREEGRLGHQVVAQAAAVKSRANHELAARRGERVGGVRLGHDVADLLACARATKKRGQSGEGM